MRNVFSVISGAALLGVALGVMILIVVMSVMNGFKKEVKDRLLSFSPHISLRYAPNQYFEPIVDWKAVSETLQEKEHVSEVAGSIDDYTIIEHNEQKLPVRYRGLDTENPEQIKMLEKILVEHQGAHSDIGLEQKAIISEARANQFGLQVGDIVQLYSTRNFDEVFKAYQKTEQPRAYDLYQDQLELIVNLLNEKRERNKTRETFLYENLLLIYDHLLRIYDDEGLRNGERLIIERALDLLNKGEIIGDKDEFRLLEKGTMQHVKTLLLDHLKEVDNRDDDMAALSGVKEIILPKDVEIAGIYRLSQQVVAPDFFIPLPVAQELSGMEEGVHEISVRLDDADLASQVSTKLSEELGYDWYATSWEQQYKDFFDIVKMQEGMMGLVLSVVSVGASFLITIVMFLMSLQKRKEIGVMLAVGARPSQIVRIFLIQGVIIGVIGVALGIALGMGILEYRGEIQEFFFNRGLDIFPAAFQGTDMLPAETPPSLLIQVSVLAFSLCCLAPLLPALYSANSDPAKSLRDL